MRKLITLTIFLSAFATFAMSHSGGTDSRGCHTDSRTGEYHCHNPK